MITINLLSPEQKQEIKNKRIYTSICEVTFLILFFTIIIALLLLASSYLLEQKANADTAKNSAKIQAAEEINSAIITANQKIDDIYVIQKNFKKWSAFLYRLAELTPSNITYSFIKIYYQESSIEIKGVAQNRADLLDLKNKLAGSALFSEVNLPLSNILNKQNNTFDIKAKINLTAIAP